MGDDRERRRANKTTITTRDTTHRPAAPAITPTAHDSSGISDSSSKSELVAELADSASVALNRVDFDVSVDPVPVGDFVDIDVDVEVVDVVVVVAWSSETIVGRVSGGAVILIVQLHCRPSTHSYFWLWQSGTTWLGVQVVPRGNGSQMHPNCPRLQNLEQGTVTLHGAATKQFASTPTSIVHATSSPKIIVGLGVKKMSTKVARAASSDATCELPTRPHLHLHMPQATCKKVDYRETACMQIESLLTLSRDERYVPVAIEEEGHLLVRHVVHIVNGAPVASYGLFPMSNGSTTP